MTLEQQIAIVEEKTKDAEAYSWKSSSEYDTAGEVDMKAADAEGVGGGVYWNHKWGRPLPCDKSEMYDLLPGRQAAFCPAESSKCLLWKDSLSFDRSGTADNRCENQQPWSVMPGPWLIKR
jgi:hypothetical protein